MRPLQQSKFKLPIVEDLGMLSDTTSKPVRFVILRCTCSNEFKTSTSNGIYKTCCPTCASTHQKAAITKALDPSNFKMKLIKDLGIINGNRKAVFECTHCTTHFTARATGKAAHNQTLCGTCASTVLRGTTDPLYSIWNTIKQRCYNTKRKDYHRYGGAGVTMADEWVDDPVAFISWCKANGWSSELVIDKDLKSAELGITPIYAPHTISFLTVQQNAELANGKEVMQYTLDGELVATYTSTVQAALAIGKPKSAKSSIANCCRGLTKSSYSFIWKYK